MFRFAFAAAIVIGASGIWEGLQDAGHAWLYDRDE
jgi:hypothetical protein